MRLFALCNKYFQWCAFFSRNYPQNQDVSPPPRPFLPELWRFPGHFPLRWQFLHVLPAKPGCFPTAPQFPPCLAAFFGTFSSAVAFSPEFVALSGTFFSVAAVPPCFTRKTRMFSYRPTISSMFCGVFRDIFLCGGSFSTFYPQNQDVSLPPHNFLPELWRFSGHFLPRQHFLPDMWSFPGDFLSPLE